MSMLEDEANALVTSFEQMLLNGESRYFDADDIDEISFVYEGMDRFEEALVAVEHGLRLHPSNAMLLTHKAKYLLLFDRIEEAEEILNALPQLSEEGVLVKTELLFTQGNSEEAHALYMEYLHRAPSIEYAMDVLFLLLDYDQEEQLRPFVEEACRLLKDGTELWRELAGIYYDKELYDTVLEIYNTLLDNDPYSLPDWLNIAKVYALRKEYEQAIEACDFALAIDDKEPMIILFKGYCLYDMGNYAEALELFLDILEVTEERYMVYELISECYLQLSLMNNAIDTLQQMIRLEPQIVSTYYQLALCYNDIGNTPEAERVLRQSLDLEDVTAEVYQLLAILLYNRGEIEEAKGYAQKAIALDEDTLDSLILMGDICMHSTHFQEATLYYERAVALSPHDIKLTFQLVLAHYNAGNQEIAIGLIQKIDDQTLQIEDVNTLPEDKRAGVIQAKEVLAHLKSILRQALDEDIE